MEQKIEQMLELESQLQSLQKEILSELNDITPNYEVSHFLSNLLNKQQCTTWFSRLVKSAYSSEIYKYDIGTKVPNNFRNEFPYSYIDHDGEITTYKLTFDIDDNGIIEDIESNYE